MSSVEIRVSYWHESQGLVRKHAASEHDARLLVRRVTSDLNVSEVRIERRLVGSWERIDAPVEEHANV